MNFAFLHKYASLMHFYRLSRLVTPWLAALTLVLLAWGVVGGLVFAPRDYQQGDSFRIIYIHVPAAFLSMFAYVTMAAAGASALIWKLKLAEIVSRACAPIGASFTFLALVTGSLWGKPMWGTWWVWDARLTSELVLLFLYLGVMALHGAFDDRRAAARAGAVLAIIGVVNIPIIHFSVQWWSTLHQGATLSKFAKPSMHIDMLIPLLVMIAAFQCYFFWTLLVRVRAQILDYDRNAAWVRELGQAARA